MTKCTCLKPHPHGHVVNDINVIRTKEAKSFEMVQVNNYENQTDDSKDGEWVADINKTWTVK